MKSIFVLLLVAAHFVSQARAAEAEAVNGILVMVNDSVITLKDVEDTLQREKLALQMRYRNQPQLLNQQWQQLRSDRIEALVEEELILQEFKTAGYTVPESFLKNSINENIKQFGDRVSLNKTLQAEGVTLESYQTKIRNRKIVELMWRTKLPPDPLISPAKIEKYYQENQDKFHLEDQVKLRAIFLTNRLANSAISPKKLAGEIAAKIDEGASFAEMAKIYSQESYAAQGGDHGWVEKTVLLKELRDAAFSMKPGKRSDIIETPEGCYLLLVEEAKPAHIRSLTEVRDDIELTLRGLENRRLRKQWIDRFKAKSYVRYF